MQDQSTDFSQALQDLSLVERVRWLAENARTNPYVLHIVGVTDEDRELVKMILDARRIANRA